MDLLLIATRTLQFASALSLAGVLGFAAFLAGDMPPLLAKQLRILARLSAASSFGKLARLRATRRRSEPVCGK